MNNKYIGILTSGGDASGMNAAIRAVTRTAIFNGFKIKGIYRGYEGLIAGEVKELTTEDVSSIIQRGGTILKTARSEAFTTPEGRKKAYEVIQKENISALIIIGGDGSLTGARIFAEEYNVTCIGLPGTIDNDLYGTDFTIGYDTALNTIVECVDKIRDTATSHDRIFFVEVMGRDAGFLAQNSAIASGAEAAIIPEDKTDVDQLETFIGRGFRKTKNSSIVIAPTAPSVLKVTHIDNGYTELTWQAATDNDQRNKPMYVIYASNDYPVDINRPENIVAQNIRETSYVYAPILPWNAKKHFAVTAIDRYGNESTATQEQTVQQ